ncbi:hypothetical protein RFI_08667 [Reticulomyxa filosa]|uniref:Uncharacterized protein n=1 Tax=Reticulomyxa filosa TaxID=46433 RepID=X6NT35_RETFI|nr:hypothetical protein RFI_08667 [Reticulomyxa filosa]|eukprot:ETO28467.1 hypothetical protein RFI_08667 [Reticulomyxa filosa]
MKFRRLNKPPTIKVFSECKWDPCVCNCIGLTTDNGLFLYKDVHTQATSYFQSFYQNKPVTVPWFQFHFAEKWPGYIFFLPQNSQNILKVQFATEAEMQYNFPNKMSNENKTKEAEEYIIQSIVHMESDIVSFELDFNCETIVCSLVTGYVCINRLSKHSAQSHTICQITDPHNTPVSSLLFSSFFFPDLLFFYSVLVNLKKKRKKLSPMQYSKLVSTHFLFCCCCFCEDVKYSFQFKDNLFFKKKKKKLGLYIFVVAHAHQKKKVRLFIFWEYIIYIYVFQKCVFVHVVIFFFSWDILSNVQMDTKMESDEENENGPHVKRGYKLLHEFQIESSMVNVMHAFHLPSADSEVIAVGTVEGNVFIYALAELQPVATLQLDQVFFFYYFSFSFSSLFITCYN